MPSPFIAIFFAKRVKQLKGVRDLSNPQNLRVPTSEEARKLGKKGGVASGKARRERKAVKELLAEFLETDVSTNKQLRSLAQKCGINENSSIKKLYIIVTVLNSIKNANFDDLAKIQDLLGELQAQQSNKNKSVEDDPLTKALIAEAKRMEKNG